MSTSNNFGCGVIVGPLYSDRILTCTAAPGKMIEVRYKTADGRIVALPPCTLFEIVNIDSDGVPLVPNMLDGAPPPSPPVLKVGDHVRIARKVSVDSNGIGTGWAPHGMDETVGLEGVVEVVDANDPVMTIRVSVNDATFWYSTEALDLIEEAAA